MIEFDSSLSRRLPVYLVLDISGSMSGSKIVSVNQGVQLLISELKKDPMALETAWVSCIAFETSAHEVLPLTEIGSASIDELRAGGTTNLGEALKMLLNKLRSDVRPNSKEQKGDYKPLVFLFSDGQARDFSSNEQNWAAPAAELQQLASRKSVNVVALACGTDADTDVLKSITPIVLQMQDTTPDVIHSFFRWVTQSVRVSSKAVIDSPSTQSGQAANLPPLPNGIQIVL